MGTKGTQGNSRKLMGTHGNPWEQKEQNNPQKGEKSKTKKRSRALKNAGKQWNQCNLAITQKRHKSYIFVTKQGTMYTFVSKLSLWQNCTKVTFL